MEQQMHLNNDEIEIDLQEIISLLLGRIWIILAAAILAGMLSLVGTMLFITPKYQSTTKMYVLSKQDSNTLTSQDMTTSLSLTKDYAVLIRSRTVIEGVISQLGLDNTYEQVLNQVNVKTETDTRVITVTVTDEDPYQACEIANAVREVASNHIKNVMDIDAVNVVDEANIPTHKSSPSFSKNTVLGALIGAILAIAVILIAYLSNDSVKTQEDVEKYLGLSTLGTIPDAECLGKKGRQRRKKSKSNKARRKK